jgi:hypothetical protein
MPATEQAAESQAQALGQAMSALEAALDDARCRADAAEEMDLAFDERTVEEAYSAFVHAHEQAAQTLQGLHARWPDNQTIATHYAACLRALLMELEGEPLSMAPIVPEPYAQATSLFDAVTRLGARFSDNTAIQNSAHYAHYDLLMLTLKHQHFAQATELLAALAQRVGQNPGEDAYAMLLATALSQVLIRLQPEGEAAGEAEGLYTKCLHMLVYWCEQGASLGLSHESRVRYLDYLADYYHQQAVRAAKAPDHQRLEELHALCTALVAQTATAGTKRALLVTTSALGVAAYRAGKRADFAQLWPQAVRLGRQDPRALEQQAFLERVGQLMLAAYAQNDQPCLQAVLELLEAMLEPTCFVGDVARAVGVRFLELAQAAWHRPQEAGTPVDWLTLEHAVARLEALASAGQAGQRHSFAPLAAAALGELGQALASADKITAVDRVTAGMAVLERMHQLQAELTAQPELAARQDCDLTVYILEQSLRLAAQRTRDLTLGEVERLLTTLLACSTAAQRTPHRLQLWLACVLGLAKPLAHYREMHPHAARVCAQVLVLLDSTRLSAETALVGLQMLSMLVDVYRRAAKPLVAQAHQRANALYALCSAYPHSAQAYAQCMAGFAL